MNILVVAGTWDEHGGESSKIARQIVGGIVASNAFSGISFLNGGNYDHLPATLEEKTEADVIIWMAKVPNHLPKLPFSLKEKLPTAILVSSKRNTNDEYSFQELISRALSSKSNLLIEFQEKVAFGLKDISANLLDPLGNIWFSGDNMAMLGIVIAKRARQLARVTRVGSVHSPEPRKKPKLSGELFSFLVVIKDAGSIFHDLIQPEKGTTRFLGNASFRCQYGFPSFRGSSGDVYVSKRNVDKTKICLDDFVQAGLTESRKVWYRGKEKPSVDTPIQLHLYEVFESINFMLHSHVYIENAPFTQKMIPCGGLEEVEEILSTVLANDLSKEDSFAVNLLGHGSIIFMVSPEQYHNYSFVKRPQPEVLSQ
jgi:hypothetical protein